jgi:hypothetical protein
LCGGYCDWVWSGPVEGWTVFASFCSDMTCACEYPVWTPPEPTPGNEAAYDTQTACILFIT